MAEAQFFSLGPPGFLGQTLFYPGDVNNNANRQVLDAVDFDGETMGKLHLWGWVRTAAIGGATNWVLLPNYLHQGSTAGDITSSLGIVLYQNADTTDTDFYLDVVCSAPASGGARTFAITVTDHAGTVRHMTGTWSDTTSPLFAMRLCCLDSLGNDEGIATLQQVLTSGILTQLNWGTI